MRHDLKAVDNELVDLIYASFLEETSWQQFLDRLAMTMPEGRSTLFYHDAASGAGAFSLHSGLTDQQVNDYNNHYSRINPWMPKALKRKIGLGVTASQMLAHDELEKTEFYNDYLLPAGARSAVGVTILRDQDRSFFLSVLTCRKEHNQNLPAAQILTRLAPHLARVFEHYQTASINKSVAQAGTRLLDLFDLGIIVVGDGGIVKTVSARAQSMLDEGGDIRLSFCGKLQINSSAASRVLHSMLSGRDQEPKFQAFLLDHIRMTIINVQQDQLSSFFNGPTAVLLLEPRNNRYSPADLHDFSDRYMLTAAETRALRGLFSGKSVDGIAADAGLSRETIRSQVKSLYAKANVRSHVELLRLVTFLSSN
ncbi:helix-turn-helix transcriptional regulator [Phyllobacterium zundukense]|uniref:HTH luxR-type domain-containing protein n=1 Tax=Phyllobacterium zundukense TaxID=1867719 RepID=A0A2N9VZL6_9HYPH|nr:LuxR C-terminal-related transcriptional regulator [Phyllobacterium zundukense]ATU90818.1 hypothetical protein BLM14_03535 [Phyllobacterium zundukense]PIO44934.1 hypothetical protein B5P45_11285 [Phyllobacterium zundukense]